MEENMILEFVETGKVIVTQKDIEEALYEMCDREHAGCNPGCLVYRLNGNKIPNKEGKMSGCDCFKNGVAMLRFIKVKEKEGGLR
jgi:hypothetical protein